MSEVKPCQPLSHAAMLRVSDATTVPMQRAVPEEMPVALVYNGATHAVMMATPLDLADFALGFSLTEGLVADRSEIETLEVVEHASGIELRMWLTAERARAHTERRRSLIGPTGCGLCGVESLDGALPCPRRVPEGRTVSAHQIRAAMEGLRPLQVLNQMTGAMHGAAFWSPERGLHLIREDVGRHNALDKLAGALDRERISPADGVVVLTSRVSVEMIQKAAAIGATVVAAISAPTALAIRTAQAAGLTLVAVARRDAFEVFTHPHRIAGPAGRTATNLEQCTHAG